MKEKYREKEEEKRMKRWRWRRTYKKGIDQRIQSMPLMHKRTYTPLR